MIDDETIKAWRENYALHTPYPSEAARYWEERCDGMAPAGAVAALGLCLQQIERMKLHLEQSRLLIESQALDIHYAQAEVFELRAELAATRRQLKEQGNGQEDD